MGGEARRACVHYRYPPAHRVAFYASGRRGPWHLNLPSFGAITIGGPLTASVFTYNPKLPAYDLINLRAGVRRNNWDIAFCINNLFDELALLSFDQERGTRARIGFLTNQPRTFGISTRLDFQGRSS